MYNIAEKDVWKIKRKEIPKLFFIHLIVALQA